MIKNIFILFAFVCCSVQSMVMPERDSKGRPIKRIAGVTSDSPTRVRFVGTHDFNIAGNQTAQGDWTVPQLQYNGENVTTIISGVEFKTVGGCDGDKVSLQIVHPIAGVMDEFGADVFIFKDTKTEIKEHRAEVPAGLMVRAVYKSTCANASRFIMNLYRYIETD